MTAWTNDPPDTTTDASDDRAADRADLFRNGLALIGSGVCIGILACWYVWEMWLR